MIYCCKIGEGSTSILRKRDVMICETDTYSFFLTVLTAKFEIHILCKLNALLIPSIRTEVILDFRSPDRIGSI